MPNYICMQRSESKKSESASSSGEKPSPEQMQEMYAKFTAWQEKFKENLIDMGGKLGTGKLVTEKGIIDGPMVEVKELLGGYMIIKADSVEEAIDVASGCPGLINPNSSVWVREVHTPGG